jgi:tetratricopeptide (TPR) repeat protein
VRRLRAKIALAALAPVAFVALCEGILWAFGIGGAAPYWVPRENGYIRSLPRPYKLHPEPVPLFLREKPPRGWRLFVLGESTVEGNPFEIGSFTDWLRLRLRAMLPDRDVEVVNAGNIGWHAAEVRALLRECLEHRPDLLVWMAGHNEFFPHNLVHLREEVESPLGTKAWRALLGLRLSRVLGRWVPALAPRRVELFDRPVTGDAPVYGPELGLLKERYREAVAGAVSDARRAGVPIVLCTMPRNAREIPPFASAFSAELRGDPGARARWDSLLGEGVAHLDAKDPARALEKLGEARRIDATPAKLHFALGRAHEQAGDRERARAAFLEALERDSFPIRAQAWVQDTIRAVAARTRAPLADLERVFDEAGALGLAGFELLIDNVHPNLAGHERIAEELLATFEREGCVSLQRSRDVDSARGRDELGITEYQGVLSRRAECLANVRLVIESEAVGELWKRTHEAAEQVLALNPEDWEVLGGLGLLESLNGERERARTRIDAAMANALAVRVGYLVHHKTQPPYRRALDAAGVNMAAVERGLTPEQRVAMEDVLALSRAR